MRLLSDVVGERQDSMTAGHRRGQLARTAAGRSDGAVTSCQVSQGDREGGGSGRRWGKRGPASKTSPVIPDEIFSMVSDVPQAVPPQGWVSRSFFRPLATAQSTLCKRWAVLIRYL